MGKKSHSRFIIRYGNMLQRTTISSCPKFSLTHTHKSKQLLHRQIQNVALSVFESDPVLSRRLSSLSLWTTLQALGRETISARIIKAFDSCRIMYDIVSRCPGIRVLVSPHKIDHRQYGFVNELHSPPDLYRVRLRAAKRKPQ